MTMVNLAVVNHVDGELETELLSLTKHGKPRLSLQTRGWYCSIDMNTNAEGASFDVKSEFGHKTPSDAVAQAKRRAQQAVKTISETSGGE